MSDSRRQVLADIGVSINNNGGTYQHGRRLPIDKRIDIAEEYLRQKDTNNGSRPNVAHVARTCQVGYNTVKRIAEIVDVNGLESLVEFERGYENRDKGGREKALTPVDKFVLVRLLEMEPSRCLKSYQRELYNTTGKLVSKATISRCFKQDFPFKATLRCPNQIPIDKFRPENLEQARQFINFVAAADVTRLKFGDEKQLKGAEIFNRKVRAHPLTGAVAPVVTNSDFRNTYSITGLCAIDDGVPSPLYFRIHEGTNDSFEFGADLELAVEIGFLRPGDFLILDNAAIHSQGDNDDLQHHMWHQYGVFIVFLPPRTPEWNPIELVWRTLVRRLQNYPFELMECQHASANAAVDILSHITKADVAACYHECGYNV